MSRYAKGVTLTHAEKEVTGGPPQEATPSRGILSHSCQVTLPDGTPCQVRYLRLTTQSHQFDFLQPLFERVWLDEQLDGGTAEVEAKAQQLVAKAFAQAQAVEQIT